MQHSVQLSNCKLDKFVRFSVQVDVWTYVPEVFPKHSGLWWPEGRKSRTKTTFSLLSWKWTWLYWGYKQAASLHPRDGHTSIIWHCNEDLVSQVCSEIPDVDFRLCGLSRSWDVTFAMHSNDGTEWRTFNSTSAHCDTAKLGRRCYGSPYRSIHLSDLSVCLWVMRCGSASCSVFSSRKWPKFSKHEWRAAITVNLEAYRIAQTSLWCDVTVCVPAWHLKLKIQSCLKGLIVVLWSSGLGGWFGLAAISDNWVDK